MLINGVYGKHLDEADENLLEDEPKKLALRSVQIVSIAPDSIIAHIQGDQLSTVDRVLVNGGPVSSSSAPVDDTIYKVEFSPPGAPEWEFLAVTGEVNPAKRKSSAVIIPNPLTLAITQAQIQRDAAEFDGATATSIPVVLIGSGFRPGLRLQTTKPGSVRTSAYISPTRWFCTVANPSALFYVTLSDPGNPAYIAGIEVNRPKPAEAKEDSADSTITEVQTKKIVTHKP